MVLILENKNWKWNNLTLFVTVVETYVLLNAVIKELSELQMYFNKFLVITTDRYNGKKFCPGHPKNRANFHEGRSMVLFKLHSHIFLTAKSEIRHNLGYLLCCLFFLLRN